MVPDPMPADSLAYTPRLTDFGLVGDIIDSMKSHNGLSVTGTLSYIPPEQLSTSATPDHSSTPAQLGDIYSLGVVMYQMLAGKNPFSAQRPIEIIAKITTAEPSPLRDLNPQITPDLAAICNKCMASVPSSRYESAQALVEDLERYAEGFPVEARPRSRGERLKNTVQRSPLESSLIAGIMVVCIVAATLFARSNQSLRKTSRSLEVAMQASAQSEKLAREAEARAEAALQDAQRLKLKALASESEALEIAYQSDMRQALAAVIAGDSANSLKIADEILTYAGEDRVTKRFDWSLLKTFASQQSQQLTQGSNTDDQTPVTEIVDIPKRGWIAASMQNGWVRVYDKTNGVLVAELKLNQTGVLGLMHESQIHALAASHDGRLLAVGNSTTASLLNWAGVTSVDLIDLDAIVEQTDDQTQDKPAQLSITRSITDFLATIESLAFTPDDRQLVVGIRYEPVQVIDIETLDSMSESRFEISSDRRNQELLINDDGQLILFSDAEQINLIDLKTRVSKRLIDKPDNLSIKQMVVTAEGDRLFFVLQESDQIQAYDLTNQPPTPYRMKCPNGTVNILALTRDNQHLIYGTTGGGVGVFKLSPFRAKANSDSKLDSKTAYEMTMPHIQYRVIHRGAVEALTVDDLNRIYSGGEDGVVAVSHIVIDSPATDVQSDEPITEAQLSSAKVTRLTKSQNPGFNLVDTFSRHALFTKDGQQLYSFQADGSVVRSDLQTHEIITVIPACNAQGIRLCMSNDQRWLMAGYSRGDLFLKRRTGNTPPIKLCMPKAPKLTDEEIRHVLFNDKGDRMIVVQGRYLVHEFAIIQEASLKDTKELFRFELKNTIRLRRSAEAVFFISDDELLLVDDFIARYRLGDAAEWEVGPGLKHVNAACFDETRQRFIIGTLNGTLNALNLQGKRVQSSRQWRSFNGPENRHHDISSLALSPDGTTLLSGSTSGQLGIWNAKNLRYLGTVIPTSDRRKIESLSVSGDSRWLALHYDEHLLVEQTTRTSAMRLIRLSTH